MLRNLDTLISLRCLSPLKGSLTVKQQGAHWELTQGKQDYTKLLGAFQAARAEADALGTDADKRAAQELLLELHGKVVAQLDQRETSFSFRVARFFGFKKATIDQMDAFRSYQETLSRLTPSFEDPTSERVRELQARLDFFTEWGTSHQKAKVSTGLDFELITHVSRAFHRLKPNDYTQNMTELFKGSHFILPRGTLRLFENDTRLRTSSHYDKGKTEKGKRPNKASEVKGHPQYYVNGPLAHSALFGPMTLATDEDGRIIHHGYSYYQVNTDDVYGYKEVDHLQLENTPDGPKWGDWLYHRCIDYALYAAKGKKHNVGPYGYGRPDTRPIDLT